MTTTLRCSDWKCTRTTINAFHDDRDWDAKRNGKGKPKATLRNILCNVHAGARRRARYQDDPLPLPDEDRPRLLKEQSVIDAQEAEEHRKAAIANDERDAQRHADEWAFMELPGAFAITADTDKALFAEEPTYEGHAWAGERGHRYDTRWFSIEPSQRDYGRAGKRPYPYVLRIVRGSNLSPTEARALSDALREAADKAEALNEARKP